jgi:Ca2+-binding RTX toxin-like protein
MRTVALALFALSVSWASTASASTVTVALDARFQSFNEVRYVAAPGEANTFTTTYSADAKSVTVTDPGATITAMGSCMSLTIHSAVCRAPVPNFPVAGEFVQSTRAELGDLNDRAQAAHAGSAVVGGIDAFGGPGDDRLIGSETEDRLDGGGGTDVITGGDGGDFITDGDVDENPAGMPPGADLMDGGPGDDEVSYRQRSKRVVVDLGDSGPDGEPGEGDTVRSFESATGGKGDDRLVGTRRDNILRGNGGRNRIIAGRGDDLLLQATGPLADCGPGNDGVSGVRAKTRLPTACERLFLRKRRGVLADSGALVDPTPDRSGGRFGLDLSCPDLDGEPVACTGRIRIVAAGSGKLLGSGRLTAGDSESLRRVLPVNLTALGDRFWGDGKRQLGRVVVRGKLARTARWTIGF